VNMRKQQGLEEDAQITIQTMLKAEQNMAMETRRTKRYMICRLMKCSMAVRLMGVGLCISVSSILHINAPVLGVAEELGVATSKDDESVDPVAVAQLCTLSCTKKNGIKKNFFSSNRSYAEKHLIGTDGNVVADVGLEDALKRVQAVVGLLADDGASDVVQQLRRCDVRGLRQTLSHFQIGLSVQVGRLNVANAVGLTGRKQHDIGGEVLVDLDLDNVSHLTELKIHMKCTRSSNYLDSTPLDGLKLAVCIELDRFPMVH